MAENKTDKRLIGTVIPVAALRSKDCTGCGEFLVLIEFARLCADMDIGLLQLLPVNDTGYESSPYFALTAFALNPLYIRLSAIPGADAFKDGIADIRTKFDAAPRFSYTGVAQAKIALLRELFAANKAVIEKSGDLKKWIDKTPWIKTYAVFRRLKEANNLKSWHEWKGFNTVTRKELEALWNDAAAANENLFWAWVQFNLDLQFREAAREVARLGIVLMGDIPILMNEDSADVWAYPEYFNNDFSAGAPPDMYSPSGQNWGFPIYNWTAHEKDNFSWWRMRLAVAEQYFGAYRIDHVLGFFRIWASSRRNSTARLGRLIPSVPIKTSDLKALGYDEGRIRWISKPHIPTGELYDAVHARGGNDSDAQAAFDAALERVGNEELWLFSPKITGERDIEALKIHEGAK
ncbi:MAG: 4-alpha-glucanotransferase, partial [Spirochaetaceae bacterium]|nr:4-alpha-glucanotransferase [Spirochaetaceae bacterium]